MLSESAQPRTGLILEQAFPRGRWLTLEAGDPPTPEALVCYLAGTLSPRQADRLRQGLVTHPSARRLLRDVSVALERVQSSAWSETADSEDTLDREVRRVWGRIVASRIQDTRDVRSRWQADGWGRVRAQAAAGVTGAQAAWTAFLGAVRQSDRLRSAPRLATARGAGGPVDISGLPDGIHVVVTAEITEDDALHVSALFQDTAGLLATRLEAKPVVLGLATGSDPWPLAQAAITGGQAVWHLPGVGTDLNLPPGPAPSDLLCLVLTSEGTEAPASAPSTRFLPAAIDGGPEIATVEVLGDVTASNGSLQITLALTPTVRLAYPEHTLILALAASPDAFQRLGAWPVQSWGDVPLTFLVPCSVDAAILDVSVLDIQLLSPVPAA